MSEFRSGRGTQPRVPEGAEYCRVKEEQDFSMGHPTGVQQAAFRFWAVRGLGFRVGSIL